MTQSMKRDGSGGRLAFPSDVRRGLDFPVPKALPFREPRQRLEWSASLPIRRVERKLAPLLEQPRDRRIVHAKRCAKPGRLGGRRLRRREEAVDRGRIARSGAKSASRRTRALPGVGSFAQAADIRPGTCFVASSIAKA